MLKMTGTICIDASRDRSWEVLSDIENIPQWSEAVLSAKSVGETPRGVGAERVCTLSNNIVIREKWVDWVDGEFYTYVGFNLPLVAKARNRWSLREEGGKTYLTTASEITFKGGIFGRILEPLMKIISVKMGTESLAALKFLIENGVPFQGKHAKLPKPLSIC